MFDPQKTTRIKALIYYILFPVIHSHRGSHQALQNTPNTPHKSNSTLNSGISFFQGYKKLPFFKHFSKFNVGKRLDQKFK